MYRQIYYLGFKAEIADNLINLTEAMYGKKYSFAGIAYAYELKKIDPKTEHTIIIYLEELSLEQRKFIWQFKINYPLIQMIFCSKDVMVANFSWQCNAAFFLPYPLSRRAVALMYQKIEERYSSARIKVKLNYQGGFDIVTSDEICFCEGDGNYTTVHLRNSKSVLMSKKIKDIFQKLSPFPEIVRIGKSYIVNVENITVVDDMKVHFKGENKNSANIVLSPVYLKRLKEHLLWFTA